MRALVIETAFLGDAIISLSLANELRRLEPTAHITYLVKPDVRDVVLACPDVDDAIAYDKHAGESGSEGIRRKAEELNARGFDTLLLLHGSRRSQALATLLQIERKIGFENMDRANLTQRVADAGWTNRYERAVLLLRAVYPEANLAAIPRFTVPIIPHVSQFVANVGRPVVLAPGSIRKTKKWGDAKYLDLARELTSRGIGVIVIGADADRKVSASIRNACPEGMVLELAGRASFIVAAGAIGCGSVLVCNDSAPAHAAVAVGTPVLTIFGPTVPAFGFGPPPGRGEVIELPQLWCRPCSHNGGETCPSYTHQCMRDITVDHVLERILDRERSAL